MKEAKRMNVVQKNEQGENSSQESEEETDSLDESRSHAYKADKKFGLLSKIDADYLKACVDEYCRDLMDAFFPEIQQLSDVRGYKLLSGNDEADDLMIGKRAISATNPGGIT